jgi:mRNA interferase MazF
MRRYYRGQVYYANLNPVVGSEQGGDRPVLILQNNTGNRYASTVIVAAISSKRDAKHRQPTHCPIGQFGVLEHPSIVLLEQLRTIDKSRLRRYVGSLSRQDMNRIDQALCVSLAVSRNLCQKG